MHQTLINTITMMLFWIVWYYSYILRKFAHNERVLPSSRWQQSERTHHVTGFVYIPRKSTKLIWNGKNFLRCVFAEVLMHGKISAAKQKILDAKRMPQNACRTKTLYMKPPLVRPTVGRTNWRAKATPIFSAARQGTLPNATRYEGLPLTGNDDERLGLKAAQTVLH